MSLAVSDGLVLASTSVYRKSLLERLGLPFVSAAPKYEERMLDLEPPKLAEAHALGKAESLQGDYPESLIIGSDQVVAFGSEILGKPGNEGDAIEQLHKLSGKRHRLITAVCLYDCAAGKFEMETDIHLMTMRPLSNEAIENYVSRERPFDCAGSYKLEKLGIALFSEIEGDDDTAVQGLPLRLLVDLLLRFGIDPLL